MYQDGLVFQAATGGFQRRHIHQRHDLGVVADFVCTAASHRGQGLGGLLVCAVASHILRQGRTPFLHVRPHNTSAMALYEKLGFRRRRTLHLALLQPPAR